MKTSVLFAACLALAAPALLIGMDATAAGSKVRTERGRLVHEIVMKWGSHVQETYRSDVHAWATSLVPLFSKAPIPSLERAARAPTFDRMNNELLVPAPGGSLAALATSTQNVPGKTLGDADQDLIFVPVTPCRIIDTRVAGGAIAANTARNFDITAVASYSFQGGDASNCNVGAAGSFAAAAINFTVVTPGAAGYITAFPFLGTQPLASTVNYTAGDIRGNFAIVRLDQGASADELSVYSFAQTHLVADIVGYYRNPGAPTLQCVNTANTSVAVAAGNTENVIAPACAGGYTQTATNCEASTWQMPFVFINAGTCSAQNNSASGATLRASRTCCRPVFN